MHNFPQKLYRAIVRCEEICSKALLIIIVLFTFFSAVALLLCKKTKKVLQKKCKGWRQVQADGAATILQQVFLDKCSQMSAVE